MEKPIRPLFELQIDEANDSIVDAVALVHSPAIESNFLAFSENKKRYQFNNDKMELLGAAMIPNMHIPRFDPKMGEYDVFFTADQIRKIWQVYMKRGFQNNTNIEHTPIPAGAYIFQSYIVDEYNQSPKGFDFPQGTLIVGMKVDDPVTWQQIKQGELQGFSIEGFFKMLKVNFSASVNTILNKDNEAAVVTSDILTLLDKIK